MKRPSLRFVLRVLVPAVIVVLIVALAARVYVDMYRDRGAPAAETVVVIQRGLTLREIGDQLAAEGVLRHPLALRLLAKLDHVEEQVRAGEFRFPAHRTTDEILHDLISGGAQDAVWVTFPEGYTSREIAQRLAGHGLGSAAELRGYFDSASIEFGRRRTKSLEGYLFPSTYLVPVNATPPVVAGMMVDEFRREIPRDAGSLARKLGFTIPQVVAVASLVEREAKRDDERPLIAGVVYNRLRRHMSLDVDATIEYIFPAHKTEITKADLAIDSPYNTYRRLGLPPTPIANPGLASLRAAFFPKSSHYLYYVYRGDGHHAFAETLSEHNANVARYLH